MRTRVSTILGVLFVLAFLLAAIACVDSYLGSVHFLSHHGEVLIAGTGSDAANWAFFSNYYGDERRLMLRLAGSGSYHHFAGFGYIAGANPQVTNYWIVLVPYWAILLCTGIPAARWVLRLRRRRRRIASGQCLHCGYDLRGSLSRCPECGILPSAAAGAGA